MPFFCLLFDPKIYICISARKLPSNSDNSSNTVHLLKEKSGLWPQVKRIQCCPPILLFVLCPLNSCVTLWRFYNMRAAFQATHREYLLCTIDSRLVSHSSAPSMFTVGWRCKVCVCVSMHLYFELQIHSGDSRDRFMLKLKSGKR